MGTAGVVDYVPGQTNGALLDQGARLIENSSGTVTAAATQLDAAAAAAALEKASINDETLRGRALVCIF